MPRKRKSEQRDLPPRQCKRSKLNNKNNNTSKKVNLRQKKKHINYGDDDCGSINLSDCIELSSNDSKDKRDNEDNESNHSSIVITETKTTKYEVGFEDLVDANDDTAALSQDVKDNVEDINENVPSVNSMNIIISLSSSDSPSSIGEKRVRKLRKVARISPSDDSSSEKQYVVEKILDMKIEDGKKKFLLKWEGFPNSDNTWEPEQNVESNDMVKEFLKNYESKNDDEDNESKPLESQETQQLANIDSDVTKVNNQAEPVGKLEAEINDEIVSITTDDTKENHSFIPESESTDRMTIAKIEVIDEVPLEQIIEDPPKDTKNYIEPETVNTDPCPIPTESKTHDNGPKPPKIKIRKIRKKNKKYKRLKSTDDDETRSITLRARRPMSLIDILDESDDDEFEYEQFEMPSTNKSQESVIENDTIEIPSDSNQGSTQSTKKTDEKKDHNAYFPTNMPQNVQEIYMVEKILKMRMYNGVRKFLLKWEGFPDSENTWEPEENLECPELIKEFLEEQKKIKKQKRESLNECSSDIEELPNEVPIKDVSRRKRSKKEPSVKPRGFPRSREAEAILTGGIFKDELMFLIKWKNLDLANLVSARRANVECPQLVIKFYEQNMMWKNMDNSITQTPKEKLDFEMEDELPKRVTKEVFVETNNTINCGVTKLPTAGGIENMPVPNVIPIRPKLKQTQQNNFQGPKVVKKYRKMDQKQNANVVTPKPAVGASSSHSMLNLINNFKERKPDNPIIRPPVEVKPIEKKPANSAQTDDSIVLCRQYDSRDIPKEQTPPKIELPKPPILQPGLRSINNYRAFQAQQTMMSRPRVPEPQMRTPFMNMPQANPTQPIHRINSDTPLPIRPKSFPNNQSMPSLTPAPGIQNSTLNAQPLNNFVLIGGNQHQIIGSLNQQLIAGSPRNNNLTAGTNISVNVSEDIKGTSLLQKYLSIPSMSLNIPHLTSPSNQSSINGNSFHGCDYIPNNKTIPTNSSSNHPLRSNSYPHDSKPSYNMPVANNHSQPTNNTNSTRMQMDKNILSQYQQQNNVIVMHPNLIQSQMNNNSLLIYQTPTPSQNQHSISQYQYSLNHQHPNYNAAVQQQPFYGQQQQPMSQSPVGGVTMHPSNVPGIDVYPMVNDDINQHFINEQHSAYCNKLQPNSDILQNSYLNLRAFL